MYLSTEDGRTVALDRFTGAMVWEYQTGFPSSSTPVVAADLVFTVTRPGVVTALEQSTGAPRWEQDLHQPILASPMIADGTLYIGASDSNLYALDAATGQLRWSFDAADWITSGVAYLEGNLVVTSQDHNLRVVGAKSGRQRLAYDTGRGRSIAGGAAIQGDVAYFGTQHGRVWAVNRQARSYPFERGILFWRSTFYIWGILPEPPIQKGGSSLGGTDLQDMTQVQKETDGQMRAVASGPGTVRSFWMHLKPPLDDPRVRRAIYLAIDREEIRSISYKGEGVTGNFFPPGFTQTEEDLLQLPGFRVDKTEDLVEAKQLLTEAGFPDGFDLTFNVDQSKHSRTEATLITEQLKKALNIQVTMQVSDRAKMYQGLRDGSSNLSIVGSGLYFLEPQTVLAQFYAKDTLRNPENWEDPRMEELM